MKKLLYVLAAVLLLSCSREENVLSGISPIEPKVYHVNFAFTGEVENDVDISREPLSKADEADTNDIYIINVYHKPPLESGYSQYAYGVFDRLENMSLNLYEGTLYQFKVTVVKDGRNKLKFFYDNSFNWGVGTGGAIIPTKVENKFILESWNSLQYSSEADRIYVKTNDVDFMPYSHPMVNRYYGEITDYSPSADGLITIDLYQAVYGVTINVTGLMQGTLKFVMADSPEVVICADSLYTPDFIFQLNGFSGMISSINSGNPHRNNINTSISWTDETGTRSVNIMREFVVYTRLERTIFNVSLKQGAVTKSNFAFSLEQEPIRDGEIKDLEAQISAGVQ